MLELCVLHAHCAAHSTGRRQRGTEKRLTDTDAACRRPKLFHVRERSVWCLTCLSREIERERERREERDQSIRHMGACMLWVEIINAATSTSADEAKRQSKLCQTVCKQFSKSSTYRDKDASSLLPPPSITLSFLVLSCLALSQRRAST